MITILLLAVMLLLAYSGVVLSRYVFASLEISGGMSMARRVHILASYWGFILMSAHLGLHWSMILGIARKRRNNKNQISLLALPLLGDLAAVNGVYVFFKKGLSELYASKVRICIYGLQRTANFVLSGLSGTAGTVHFYLSLCWKIFAKKQNLQETGDDTLLCLMN